MDERSVVVQKRINHCQSHVHHVHAQPACPTLSRCGHLPAGVHVTMETLICVPKDNRKLFWPPVLCGSVALVRVRACMCVRAPPQCGSSSYP